MATPATTSTNSHLVDGELCRARIYWGEPMTMDKAMMYVSQKHGMLGESANEYPASYLATHIVEDGGRCPMEPTTARIMKRLLSMGWVERAEVTFDVPADNERYSMFRGTPAYRATHAYYHATAKGRAEWNEPVA